MIVFSQSGNGIYLLIWYLKRQEDITFSRLHIRVATNGSSATSRPNTRSSPAETTIALYKLAADKSQINAYLQCIYTYIASSSIEAGKISYLTVKTAQHIPP